MKLTNETFEKLQSSNEVTANRGLESLIEESQEYLTRYLRSHGAGWDDINDALNRVWFYVWNQRAKYQSVEALPTILYRMAYQEICKVWDKENRHKEKINLLAEDGYFDQPRDEYASNAYWLNYDQYNGYYAD